MQFMPDLEADPLALHEQDSVSLLNSRLRMDCEPSETSRYLSDGCEEQMKEFQT
jgi:hypothetical protein